MRGFTCCIAFAVSALAVRASTPQMGWNSWNAFGADINEGNLNGAANALISTGLRDAGYEYFIVDEGWQALHRDTMGRQQANATKFPSGITAFVKQVHSLGLKFGIYSDAGIYDCDFYPGSWGFEELDAQTYAEWLVDYLKYDNCGGFEAMTEPPQVRFSAMRDALRNSGRDIFFSLCEWGFQFPWYWADQIGQSYRISGDITDVFSDKGNDCACKTAYCLNTGYAGCSVLTILRKMREIAPFQHLGSFADMDLLQIGNGNMTLPEQRTHMSFWAAMKSPLIISTDIPKLSNESLAVLMKAEIIALNKDATGKAPLYIPALSVEYEKQVWVGELTHARKLVLILNELNKTATIGLDFKSIPGFGEDGHTDFSATELWSGETYRKAHGLNLTVQAHDTQVFILS